VDIFSKTVIQTHGRNYDKDEIIFSEGEPCRKMFIINSGTVRIIKQKQGQNICLSTLGPGEFIGEIEGGSQPRNVSAIAESKCTLVVIDSDTFSNLVKDNHQLAWKVIKKLNQRIRSMNEKLLKTMTENDSTRLAQVLMEWVEDPYRRECIEEKSIASAAGILPSVVTALMTRLGKSGVLLPCGPGKWRLKDGNALEEFVEYCIRKSQMDPLDIEELAELTGLQSHEAKLLAIRAIEKRLASSSSASEVKELMTPLQRYLKLKLRFELSQDDLGEKKSYRRQAT